MVARRTLSRMREKAVIYSLGAFSAGLFIVATLIGTDAHPNWGDVPTWFAGGVAILALIAARQAGRTALRLLEVEELRENRATEAEEQRREAQERAEQADLVASWIDVEGMRRGTSLPRWGTLLQNASSLPVWDVVVEIFGPNASTPRHRFSLSLLPPGRSFEPWGNNELRSRKEDAVAMTEHSSVALADDQYQEDPRDFRVAISFRDAAGRKWRRTKEGVLRKTGIVVFGEAAVALASIELKASGIVTPPPEPLQE